LVGGPATTNSTFLSGHGGSFKKRYGLSEAEKWKAEKEIWARVQGADESVQNYVTAMQLMANKVSMSSDTLKKAIIQGLLPELRLFVLNAHAQDIQELLAVAKTCETARAVKSHQQSNIDNLTDMVGSLLNKVTQLANKETAIKRVQFVETAVQSRVNERQQNSSRYGIQYGSDDGQQNRSGGGSQTQWRQSARQPPVRRPGFTSQQPRMFRPSTWQQQPMAWRMESPASSPW